MILKRLRLTGFKSFVDAAEFVIEPGLTGIVGPNGCGKSNLVEGLRWVMGESSHKALRASGMEDVIFAGSADRPARNSAEIVLTLDNSAHTAPAPWTAEDTIEIARRIERERGSVYRINSREVRARDVQILFADASTGARSPALVRQGQIGEIINAKPEARRRVLEEAAGIAGLHARRHEAEIRLRTADQNLLRVEDAVGRLAAQVEGLKRQARQAGRYRSLSADIRRLESVVLERAYAAAVAEAAAGATEVAQAERQVAGALRVQSVAARDEGVASHAMPALREAAAAAAATLERLRHAGLDLDREERHAKERLAEVERQLAALTADARRETALGDDAAASLARLAEESAALGEGTDEAAAEAAATGAAAESERSLMEAERSFAETTTRLAERRAARSALEKSAREIGERVTRIDDELKKIRESIAAIEAEAAADPLAEVIREAEAADKTLARAEAALRTAESDLQGAREAERIKSLPLKEAEASLRRSEVEVETLTKLLGAEAVKGISPALDHVTVERGYEMALGAALSEDLQAPLDSRAPVYWRTLPGAGDPALPSGVEPLAAHVTAPEALARRLAQIGLVDRAEGFLIQDKLEVGQRLVSKDGDLWRWDGFTAAAEAPTATARRLAERNRLADLQKRLAGERLDVERYREEFAVSQEALSQAAAGEVAARDALRQARQTVDALRGRRAGAERAASERTARSTALRATAERMSKDGAEARRRHAEVHDFLSSTSEDSDLDDELAARRLAVEKARTLAAEIRAAREARARESEQRRRRREAIARERQAWASRGAEAAARLDDLQRRRAALLNEQESLNARPADIAARRATLQASFGELEQRARRAADELAAAESQRIDAERAARAALETLSRAREELVRTETRRDSLQQRVKDAETRLAEALGREPLGVPESEASIEQLSDELESLKRDRERLGPVNLRAEDELAEVQTSLAALTTECNDLNEAIRKLRHAIQTLNREGRERLNTAFVQINGHFQAIFITLFGGGEAYLSLVKSDDPLDAGLEIMARPPGKKPQTLSLLSGGEQALTAMALIFAIFLTNPAPVCVLDEVDAPLDDANVERFCDLLEAMRQETNTRFLVVTHNPVTMSRMDRLFGVTMAERGVSQLVSVDLETAERLRDAG